VTRRAVDRSLSSGEPLTPRTLTALGLASALPLVAFAGFVLGRIGSVDDQLKSVLLVIAALAVVAALLEPALAFAAVVALVPFQFHFTAPGLYTGTNEVIIIGSAVVLLWRLDIRLVPVPVACAGAALVIGGFISVAGAHDPTAAFWGAIRWSAAITILFAAFAVLPDQARVTRWLMNIVAVTGGIVALFGFAQSQGVFLLAGPPFDGVHPDSFFGYYTAYAGFLAVAAVLVTGEVLQAWSDRLPARAWALGVALFIILLGVAVSQSRGALLALTAGWVALLVLSVPRGSLALRAGLVLAVFAATAYVATPGETRRSFAARFQQPVGAEVADQQRFALQSAGVEALKNRPLGLGYGNFRFHEQGARGSFIQQGFFHSHRTPVQVGLDAGWLGLAGFAALCLWPFALAFRALARRTATARGLAFVAGITAFLAQGLFDYQFFEIAFLMVTCVLVWGAWREL
jgi:O-antigen ligase